MMSFKLSLGKLSFARVPLFTNEAIAALPINDEKEIDATFLYYALQTINWHDFGRRAVKGSTLNKEILEAVPVSFPPPPEQRRVAALLDRADRLRRARRYVRELSDGFLQAVFLEMFGDDLKRGSTKSLSDVAAISGGGTPSRDRPDYYKGCIPWVTAKDMHSTSITDAQEHVTDEAIRNSAAQLVPAGTILMVVKSKVLMHRLPIALTKRQVCHNQDIKSLHCSPNMNPFFLLSVLRYNEPNLLQQARGANTEGLTLPMLNEVRVPDVEKARQEGFAAIVRTTERLRAQQREAERQAEHLFQTLLHRAFSDH